MDTRESYDSAAQAYAEHLAAELDRKPLDRHLLNRFAEELRGRGVVADLGCGPGHVARYLQDRGVQAVGVDLSPEMVRVAKSLNPGIEFSVGDIRRLDVPDGAYAGVVLFYSLVHFEPSELGMVLREVRRVLAPEGLVLVGFHIGDGVVHVDELFGSPVSLDFRFFPPTTVSEALRRSGLAVTEYVEREPYEGAEYPSRRCYLLARALNQPLAATVVRPDRSSTRGGSFSRKLSPSTERRSHGQETATHRCARPGAAVLRRRCPGADPRRLRLRLHGSL